MGQRQLSTVFFFFLELFLFSSAVAGIFSLSHSSLCLSLYYYNFFFFLNPLIYSVQVIEVGTAWAKVIEAGTAWAKPQFQANLPSCPSYLSVRRIRAQQSSCLPWTRGESFSSASIPLPFVSWPLVWVLRLHNLLTAFVLRPSVREFHQRALLVAFILWPSIREFRQHASSISTPFSLPSSCGLQYGSSISMPFSLLHLAAFNTRVPSTRPSHCLTLQPSIREFHQHALLIASPCGL